MAMFPRDQNPQYRGAPPDAGGWPSRVVSAGPIPGLSWAGIGVRMGALLIDVGLLLIALIALTVAAMATGIPYDSEGSHRSQAVAGVEVLWLVVMFLYMSCCWSLFQGTLGQRALGLRVVRVSDGKSLGVGASMLRFVVWLVCVWTILLGIVAAIAAANQPERRSLVDLAAGSVVVRKT